MPYVTRQSMLWAASGIALAVAGQVQAEESAASQSQIQLEEVIVTAEKTEETAQKVPVALSVYTENDLKNAGVVSVTDLANVAPAVEIGRSAASGVAELSVRGITTSDTTTKGDQNIAFIVDGISLNRSQQFSTAFFDINRIEVLRGPQGTLYGKSTTGGVFNIVTNKPGDHFDASADVEFGDYNTQRVNAMVNLPITDSFALRFAANSNQRSGWVYPSINDTATDGAPSRPRNDQNDRTGRLTALWSFGDRGSLTLTDTYGTFNTTFPANVLVDPVGTLQGSATTGWVANVQLRSGDAETQVYANPFNNFQRGTNQNVNTELNLLFGAVRMTADVARLKYNGTDMATSYNNNNSRLVSGTPAYSFEARTNQYTSDYDELRFSNANPGRFTWVAGANYSWESLYQPDASWNVPVTAFPSVYSPAAAPTLSIISTSLHLSKGYFGQASFNVTDDLKLTAGGRESYDSSERRNAFFYPGFPPNPLNAQGTPCTAPQVCIGSPELGYQDASKFTWRLGADYQLTSNQMVYVSAATGYKAGSFNDFGFGASGSSATPGPTPYAPEDMVAYELGFKGDLLPTLRLNTDVYYYDYRALQVLTTVNVTPTAPSANNVRFTRSVPATLYGWENELTWKVTQSDRLDVALYFERGHFNTLFVGPLLNIDWSGKKLGLIPDVTGTLAYTHEWVLPNDGTFDVRLSTRYNSGYNLNDVSNRIIYHQDSFTRSDINLTYTSPNGKFSAAGYVHNVEDKLQMIDIPGNVVSTAGSGSYNPTGWGSVPTTDPRTVGVRLSLKM